MAGQVYAFFEKALGEIERAAQAGDMAKVIRVVSVAKQGAIALDDVFQRLERELSKEDA